MKEVVVYPDEEDSDWLKEAKKEKRSSELKKEKLKEGSLDSEGR